MLRQPRANALDLLVLIAIAAGCWAVTANRMEGMDMSPGTELGGLGWFLGAWVVMMAAMMLPSVAPMVLAFARVAQHRSRLGRVYVPTWVFAAW